jgi:ABC-type dipeptide/oligopeptide/nickel transport system permease component
MANTIISAEKMRLPLLQPPPDPFPALLESTLSPLPLSSSTSSISSIVSVSTIIVAAYDDQLAPSLVDTFTAYVLSVPVFFLGNVTAALCFVLLPEVKAETAAAAPSKAVTFIPLDGLSPP